MLLGVRDDVLPESCHQFLQSDRLVLFTDGLSEARNEEHDMFGAQAIHDLIRKFPRLSPEELSKHVFDQIDQFRHGHPQDDDQTIVIIDFDNVAQKS